MNRLFSLALAASAAAAAAPPVHGGLVQRPVSWTAGRAEARIVAAPPRNWLARGWSVVIANCDGSGPAARITRDSGSARRYYRDFSCEITVVRPLGPCSWVGIYACVAGYESTAELRTLHVLDETRYALYRVP